MLRQLQDRLANANPWLVYLPFLLLYCILALFTSPHDQLVLDEGRYWGFAENLLNGHFHYKEGYQFLWSGPGYPILLMPFVAFESPLWVLKLLNAGLLFSSVVLFSKLLRLYVSPRQALYGALLFACYYPMYEVGLPYVMTEAWSMFLTIAPTYFICKAFRFKDYRLKTLILPSVLLGMLALTKVIFGYVFVGNDRDLLRDLVAPGTFPTDGAYDEIFQFGHGGLHSVPRIYLLLNWKSILLGQCRRIATLLDGDPI
jgi:hypothetical protein